MNDDLVMQIEHIRRSGEFSMFMDARLVIEEVAPSLGFDELASLSLFVYNGLLRGFQRPSDEDYEAWLNPVKERGIVCPKCGYKPMNQRSVLKGKSTETAYTCPKCRYTFTCETKGESM